MKLHWRILIGLVAGILVGIILNFAWNPYVWGALGVGHSESYLESTTPERLSDRPARPQRAVAWLEEHVREQSYAIEISPIEPPEDRYLLAVVDWFVAAVLRDVDADELDRPDEESALRGMDFTFASIEAMRDQDGRLRPLLIRPLEPPEDEQVAAALAWLFQDLQRPPEIAPQESHRALEWFRGEVEHALDRGAVAQLQPSTNAFTRYVTDWLIRDLLLMADPEDVAEPSDDDAREALRWMRDRLDEAVDDTGRIVRVRIARISPPPDGAVRSAAAWLVGPLVTPQPNEDAGIVAGAAAFLVNLTNFGGELFIRALMFIAVPIVLFSLIVGASSLNDLRKLSRIGGKTIGIYLCTTALSITIGLTLANIIRPGLFIPPETRDELQAAMSEEAQERLEAADPPSVWNTLLDIVPSNPFEAVAETKMLQIVFFALVIGIALTLIPKAKSEPIIRFFDGLTDVIIKLVHIIMYTAPYAVFALIAPILATMGMDVLVALLAYASVVVLGLLVMILAVYPGIMRIFTTMRYVRFFRGIAPAQLLAFSSSSSVATLPVTMECVEERLGVSEEVTSFVCPLGATINMDGTALYQGVAAVFIAQMYGLDLTIGQQLTIVLTATLASIGTAGVPGVGIIMLVIVLQAAQIPLEGIAVILGVDRLLDMCRTCCNVTGDGAVATIVAGTEGDLLTEEEVMQRRSEMKSRGLDEHPPERAAERVASDGSARVGGAEQAGSGKPSGS